MAAQRLAARSLCSQPSRAYSAAPAPGSKQTCAGISDSYSQSQETCDLLEESWPADDDVVLEVFREQQKSYRDLLEGMKASIPK